MIWPWKKEPETDSSQDAGEDSALGNTAYSDFVAALPDPVLLLDRHGVVIAANRQAIDVLDFDPVGNHVSAAIRAPQILEAVEHVLDANDAVRVDYEMHVPLPRHFEAYIAHVAGSDEAAAAIILLRDLTREQQIERMRADFVAHASHELRTPLAYLLGFIDTLEGAARLDEAARVKFL
jgi:two-component system phosphate regulon sensor histidine kinase PhoR